MRKTHTIESFVENPRNFSFLSSVCTFSPVPSVGGSAYLCFSNGDKYILTSSVRSVVHVRRYSPALGIKSPCIGRACGFPFPDGSLFYQWRSDV